MVYACCALNAREVLRESFRDLGNQFVELRLPLSAQFLDLLEQITEVCLDFTQSRAFDFDPAGALNAGPYFHVAMSKGPWFSAPGGAIIRALLSLPAGAASGNVVVPGAALLA